jgi:glycosyltransferase involved in cell wall biosynthesis
VPERPLRVGLNLIFLGEHAGGVGRYARRLPGALLAAEPRTELHLFVSRDAPADMRAEQWASEVRWTTLPIGLKGPPLHVPAEYLALPALAAARRLDVLHSPANTGPAIAPGVVTVVSIMDLIWLHRPEEWEASPRVHRTMRRRVERAVRNADRLFTISHATAEDLVNTLGAPCEHLEVTPLAAEAPQIQATSEQALRSKLDLGDARVVLCVAQKRPYKNLNRLVRALPALPGDVVLVLPGAPTSHEEELRALADELGVGERVRFLEWLSEADLEGLYAVSSAFVLPSLIEGFGLPILEAMQRNLPVACSNTSSLPEVAGDAALLFDPQSQPEIDAAIRRLLENRGLAQGLCASGWERAASYTWQRTGRATLAGYRRALAGRHGNPGHTGVRDR